MKLVKRIAIFSTVCVLATNTIACSKNIEDDILDSRIYDLAGLDIDSNNVISNTLEEVFSIDISDEDSEFLNTITGEIGSLEINALVDDTGKIDFERVNSINNILSIESNTLLGLPTSEEKQQAKIKKLRCDKKIDD